MRQENIMKLITRDELATRWSLSKRTIDRLREYGIIPWTDLSKGIGKRPIVRFRLYDIESYEEKNTKKLKFQ
jgi:hypothetical protein